MARIVNNNKGFKVIALSPEEANNLGWGTSEGQICMRCNNIIKDEVYYIAVLNDVMCKECYEEFIKHANHYPEDSSVEYGNFDYYIYRLGI